MKKPDVTNLSMTLFIIVIRIHCISSTGRSSKVYEKSALVNIFTGSTYIHVSVKRSFLSRKDTVDCTYNPECAKFHANGFIL